MEFHLTGTRQSEDSSMADRQVPPLSMIGKFAVEPGRFKEILSDPFSGTELFMAKSTRDGEASRPERRDAGAGQTHSGGGAAHRWIGCPQIQEQLAERFKRLGVDVEAVKSGSVLASHAPPRHLRTTPAASKSI